MNNIMKDYRLKITSALAMFLFCFTMTTVANSDTTFVVDNKTINIGIANDRVNVSVFETDGSSLKKISEHLYSNSQETERIYVTSPLTLSLFHGKSVKHNEIRFCANLSHLYFGRAMAVPETFDFSNHAEMHSRYGKSFEIGLSVATIAIPFNKMSTIGVHSAIQLAHVRHHFKTDYIMTNENDYTVMKLNPATNIKKSFLSYMVIRVPLLLRMQKSNFHISIGGSLDYRFHERSRYKEYGKKRKTISRDLNMRPLAVNAEVNIGYKNLTIYMRQSLTPLLDTNFAPKCYPLTIGFGI